MKTKYTQKYAENKSFDHKSCVLLMTKSMNLSFGGFGEGVRQTERRIYVSKEGWIIYADYQNKVLYVDEDVNYLIDNLINDVWKNETIIYEDILE